MNSSLNSEFAGPLKLAGAVLGLAVVFYVLFDEPKPTATQLDSPVPIATAVVAPEISSVELPVAPEPAITELESPDIPVIAPAIAPAIAPNQPAVHFQVCGGGKRITCVVDGDTFWLNGTKIRVLDIDAPEASRPQCPREKQLADLATQRLTQLLNEGEFELRGIARDEDRYGRKLRSVHRDGQSLGDVLLKEGLAQRYAGRKPDWCN